MNAGYNSLWISVPAGEAVNWYGQVCVGNSELYIVAGVDPYVL